MESDNQPYSPAHGSAHLRAQESDSTRSSGRKTITTFDAFPDFGKNVECCDGLRRGEAHGGIKASCSERDFFHPTANTNLDSTIVIGFSLHW